MAQKISENCAKIKSGKLRKQSLNIEQKISKNYEKNQ